ncbi:MAG: gliding motility-associated C-terminal domain-containing protein, partial [Bacteroidota bacterium]
IPNPVAGPGVATRYVVTVGNQYNCTSKDFVLVNVTPNPIADAGPDASVCKGKTSVSLKGSGGEKYLWSPAAGLSDPTIAQPVASPSATTLYIVTVRNQYSCSASDSVLVTVFTNPTASAGPDKTISVGQSIVLNGTAGGDTSYFWTPAQFISNAQILAPTVSPAYDITYTLHVGPENACGTATDDVVVHVTTNLIIPNAFSPNGDGINDTWNIGGLGLFAGAEIKVFNRFGQVVFYSRDYPKPWDGRINGNPLPAGTYYYTLDRKKNLPFISGWVALIR